jgi:hypothetical protein
LNNVITREQAKRITGGRTPLVPVEYEAAVTALQCCLALDEAKTWGDKADALAAWAKIYRNDDAGRKARQLKLHAYRRMGELALELRPKTYRKGLPKIRGAQLPGPHSLLLETGLTRRQAHAASKLAHLDAEAFQKLADMPRPPSPSSVINCNTNSDEGRCMQAIQMLSFHCRKLDAAHMAAFVEKTDRYAWREQVPFIVDWLDEFEQRLKATRS